MTTIPDRYTIQRVLFWTGIAILFAMPIELFSLLLEFFHLLFEGAEASLDFIIEVTFGTSLHSTQVIVFYILLAAILYGIYQLWKVLPDFFRQQKINLLDFVSDETNSMFVYWNGSVINKVKLVAAGSALLFLLLT